MFIAFVIKCILGTDPDPWENFPRFPRWPLDIPWSPIILSEQYRTLVCMKITVPTWLYVKLSLVGAAVQESTAVERQKLLRLQPIQRFARGFSPAAEPQWQTEIRRQFRWNHVRTQHHVWKAAPDVPKCQQGNVLLHFFIFSPLYLTFSLLVCLDVRSTQNHIAQSLRKYKLPNNIVFFKE